MPGGVPVEIGHEGVERGPVAAAYQRGEHQRSRSQEADGSLWVPEMQSCLVTRRSGTGGSVRRIGLIDAPGPRFRVI